MTLQKDAMTVRDTTLSLRHIQLPLMVFLASYSSIAAVGAQTLAEKHEQYRYRVTYVDTPPTVDGDLSDPVWREAQVLDRLIQKAPNYGQPATEKTEVRIVYDSTALYIGVYCYDSDPAGIVRNVLRFRDDSVWTKDDVVRIILDTFHDHRRAYVFSINALGTKQDSQVDNEKWHSDWDEVWDVRTQLQEDGWSAELYIPFRILRFPSGGDGVWGFNVMRDIQRKNEGAYWAPVPPGISFTRAAYHGHLEGFSTIEPELNLQVIPYGLVGASRSNGRSTIASDLDAGADLKLALTSSLTLDLTYNPNFAQVEVDDQQINLTRFRLFFPERRGFFLENSQLFNFGIPRQTQMFFSRRIGLSQGEAVPILGGARLSGKAGSFDLGLLTIQTESHPTVPSTNFSATRLRWNVWERSYIGGIFTSVHSETQGNRVFGPDALFWLGKNFRLEGFLGVMEDRTLAEHPISHSSAAVYNQDLWGVSLRTLYIDEEFDPAMGFIRRQGIQRYQGSLRRSVRLNRKWARKLNFSGDLTYLTDQQGELETRQWVIETSNELDSGDRIFLTWEGNFERLAIDDDPFEVNPREGLVIPPDDYGFNRWRLGYEGFTARAFRAAVGLEGGTFFSGRRTTFTTSGIWRASPHLVLSGDYELNDITLPEGAFASHLWRTRFSVPFTARVIGDAFLQWDSLARELSTQLRFHLIYGRDSNFFVVFTDRRENPGGEPLERDWAIQAKLTYRLYW